MSPCAVAYVSRHRLSSACDPANTNHSFCAVAKGLAAAVLCSREGRATAPAKNVIDAGAICLGLVLGTALVQRLPPRALGRWRTWALFAFAAAATAATCAAVAGAIAVAPLLVAAITGLLVRSLLDLSSTHGAAP